MFQGEDVHGRLEGLIEKIEGDEELSPPDLSFLENVAAAVGVGPTRVARHESERGAFLSELLDRWKRGSRATGRALLDAYHAEDRGYHYEARQVLQLACRQIGMPLYAEILEGELRRITDIESTREKT
jgi:hypothetical protein